MVSALNFFAAHRLTSSFDTINGLSIYENQPNEIWAVVLGFLAGALDLSFFVPC